MNEDKYIAEIINPDEIQYNKLNLIEAPCGSGKTTFVTKYLPQYAKKEGMLGVLLLIDTRCGKEQIKAHGEIHEYNGTEYYTVEGVTVMTYAGFATMVTTHGFPRAWDVSSYIVCDELQNCIKYSLIPTDGVNIHQTALELIHQRIKGEGNKVIAISATPKRICTEFKDELVYVPLHGIPKSYKNKRTLYYSNLTALVQSLPSDKRGIIYVTRIRQIKTIAAILNQRGIKTVGIWSENNTDYHMTEEQQVVSDSIVKNEIVPDGVQVLLINASSETSINVNSFGAFPVDYVIVHSSDEEARIQARSRYRGDIAEVYYYDSDIQTIELPDYLLSVPVSKEDIQEFISVNNIRNKERELIGVPTFYKFICSAGYSFEPIRKNNKRACIITK